jgi:hypothetical protein
MLSVIGKTGAKVKRRSKRRDLHGVYGCRDHPESQNGTAFGTGGVSQSRLDRLRGGE